MQLNDLKPKTKRKTSKRVGRGRGSGKGKTAGRGTKGQNARAGHKKRPEVREQLKKIPKLRGRGIHALRSIGDKPMVINLASLEAAFSSGDTISPTLLLERGVLNARKGALPKVKVLGDGELTKKFTLSGFLMSASAKEKVEKAGGTIN